MEGANLTVPGEVTRVLALGIVISSLAPLPRSPSILSSHPPPKKTSGQEGQGTSAGEGGQSTSAREKGQGTSPSYSRLAGSILPLSPYPTILPLPHSHPHSSDVPLMEHLWEGG